ncbi:MAG: DUF4153 domain-containing protein [Alphaproteobacteria bacterium]|nr:DUF4153 domain-containing protein [Alphaproteobacteria bacterium]MBU0795388.1 DUF4153 domain-containing protein [Alphaproteobacteria bacterium]MBU0874699.1 DUF4153 domain-containing protein [Alphaproteobacteria bacterium]MBU1770107.1 DUF4153 domain-containing protein [Alphaproteobacteria bacterium]
MASNASTAQTVWPLRTWVLAGLGALIGLAIDQFSDPSPITQEWLRRLIAALPMFLSTAGLAFGLSWRRRRPIPAIVVALICGLIGGGVFLWNGVPGDGPSVDIWHLVCGTIAAAAVLVLFQSAQDRSLAGSAPGAPSGISPRAMRDWAHEAVHYEDIHGHLWTNALLIGASGMFMLLSFGIAHLLAEMFMLVKLTFLRDALRESAVVALLCGAAFGAALGLLRDRGAIIAALQRVAMLVLRVLAPVVALALAVFLAALPVTGLAPLWATGGTTPIMLAGAVLALFLANAVVGDTAEDESRSVLLGASAAALGLFLLPMVGIAVFSSGLRIHQHGLTPERLWALAFLIVASITAIAYAVAILGPRGWFVRLRRTNRALVFLIAGIALLLSTPIFGFERIATANQLQRLAGGQVSPEKFDYKALWFDFGPPGRAAIRRLAASSSDATIRRLASETSKLTDRWSEPPAVIAARAGESLDARLTILPAPVLLPTSLRQRIVRYDACGDSAQCLLRYVPGEDFAIVIAMPAADCRECAPSVRLIRQEKGVWTDRSDYLGEGDVARRLVEQVRAGVVDVRPVMRRQLYIGGEAVGESLPPASEAQETPVAP